MLKWLLLYVQLYEIMQFHDRLFILYTLVMIHATHNQPKFDIYSTEVWLDTQLTATCIKNVEMWLYLWRSLDYHSSTRPTSDFF